MEKLDISIERVMEILREETPLGRHANIYIALVRERFDTIRLMREKKFNFVQICRAFVNARLLPEDADARYLRQAFKRELGKREKKGSSAALINANLKQIPRQLAAKPEKSAHIRKMEEIQPVSTVPNDRKYVRPGLQVNPDNTFVIRPIDPDDLPDI